MTANSKIPFAPAVSTAMLIFLSLLPTTTQAADVTFHIGPPSMGSGGNNPLSIPPTRATEYELVFVSDSDFETTIGIIPGLFFGKRSETSSGFYASLGGGLVVDANGYGPGAYSALGVNLGRSNFVLFNAEFKQAIGISEDSMLFPHALRVGITMDF